MNKISQLHDKIARLDACINLVIQVQSYGRVFVWDQLGIVCAKDHDDVPCSCTGHRHE